MRVFEDCRVLIFGRFSFLKLFSTFKVFQWLNNFSSRCVRVSRFVNACKVFTFLENVKCLKSLRYSFLKMLHVCNIFIGSNVFKVCLFFKASTFFNVITFRMFSIFHRLYFRRFNSYLTNKCLRLLHLDVFYTCISRCIQTNKYFNTQYMQTSENAGKQKHANVIVY